MRQERAERTRIALLGAAAAVFDQLGYEGATLTGVSDKAMMSKGALFFHFANKAELADTVQKLACSSSRSRLDALFGRGIPALQTVIDMTHSAARQLVEDPVVRAGMRLTMERETPRDPETHLRLCWQKAFEDAVLRAEADGSLRPDLLVRPLADMALALVNGAYAAHLDQESDIRRWLIDAWELVLPAVAVQRHPWRFHRGGVLPGARSGRAGGPPPPLRAGAALR